MIKRKLIFIYLILSFLSIDYLFIGNRNVHALAQGLFESHTIINKFTVLIPAHWNAKTQSHTDDFFVFTNYEMEDKNTISTESIKTEVVFLTEPLDVIINNRLRAIKYSQESIIKKGDMIIDGKPAKRIWCQGEGIDFTHSISSYIAYDRDRTVIIHSYYHPQNPLAVDTIETVHWSFKHLQ